MGRSSCRVSVPVIVSNAGAAPSGAFDVLTVFDRAQGVEVESNLPDGLSSGASEVLVIEAETEGACFDPDCEICATADPDNDIAEADEGNNTLCREPAG